MLPLVTRTARALSEWLSAGLDGGLELRPDLDGIEALAGEREALWTRLEKATFLTVDEKRAAAGYGPAAGNGLQGPEGGGLGFKYSPDQPRDELGRWTDAGGGQPGDATVADEGAGGENERPRSHRLSVEIRCL